MEDDQFVDAFRDGTIAEVIDNGDGAHVMVNVTGPDGRYIGLALTADDANRMAEVLQTLAAGLYNLD